MVHRQVTRKCLVDEIAKQLPGYTRHAHDIKQRHVQVTLTTTSRCMSPWLAANAMFLEMMCAMRLLIHGADAACIPSMSNMVVASPSHSPAVCTINRTYVRQHTWLGKYTVTQTNDQDVVSLQNGQRTELPAFA